MEALLKNVKFSYGDELILDVPEVCFFEGRVTALVGPNGSGKSTLLRLLAGLESPHSGHVLIGRRPSPPAREYVAYAFQEAVFLSGSLHANLDLGLRLRGLPSSERGLRIEEAANACGVDHLLDRPANRLSGGEAQRANLARALSLRAPLTLLDEPLSGFDEEGRRQMLEELPGLLRRFAGTTVLVTHDRNEALHLATDLVLLHRGRIRAAGPKREVFSNPSDPESASFLGYTILQTEDGLVGISPGAFQAGTGDFTVSLEVEEVIDLVDRVEVVGWAAGQRIAVNFPPDSSLPSAGEQVIVSAPTGMVMSFTDPVSKTVDSLSRAPVA
ncbi:MAG: spermidine/putrescine ABC transporter ATP-binding protein [Dehalococcoidia bacterium]|nr:spermidine/putrescine ABC transporter ATP-binding protein [Dehalococcoidia bacterium]HCV00106.1 spermidine/putrescine ABC transporter ATP-binding protein [Dehalococcoidia bacterium]|tara:strand:- start:1058 stop:2044 length:987 start_codon:yes stop_codon:yes gene_type:complete